MTKISQKLSINNIHKLIVLSKMRKGQEEIKAGKGLTTEQAKRKLKRWLK